MTAVDADSPGYSPAPAAAPEASRAAKPFLDTRLGRGLTALASVAAAGAGE